MKTTRQLSSTLGLSLALAAIDSVAVAVPKRDPFRGFSRDAIGPRVRGTLKQPYVDARGRRYYSDEKGRVRRLR